MNFENSHSTNANFDQLRHITSHHTLSLKNNTSPAAGSWQRHYYTYIQFWSTFF